MEPYITFVTVSRNDNHGGSLTRRMQIFVNGLAAQCKRHNLPAELLLVEWNPPGDRRPLAEELTWPEDPSPLQIRIITVPNELHRLFKCSDNLPLYQMIAKNAGIRRARAPFILATNIDILFNDELMHFFSEYKLEKDKMYRIDRYDAMTDVPLDASIQEQLAYCQNHMVRVGRREGTIPTNLSGEPKIFDLDIVLPNSGIRLGKGWYLPAVSSQNTPYRYMRSGAELLVRSPDASKKMVSLEIEPAAGVRNKPFRISFERPDGTQLARGIVFGKHIIHVALPLEPDHSEVFLLRLSNCGHVDVRNANQMDAKVYSCDWSPKLKMSGITGLMIPNEFEFKNMVPEIIIPKRGLLARIFANRPFGFDIVGFEDGIQLGENWNAFEIKGAEYLRHVDSGAEILVDNEDFECRKLILEVESAVGLCYESFDLRIHDEFGNLIASHHIRGNPKRKERLLRNRSKPRSMKLETSRRAESKFDIKQQLFRNRFRETVTTCLPLKKNAQNRFTLSVANCAGLPADGKFSRGFKVYKCTWEKADENGGDVIPSVKKPAAKNSALLLKSNTGSLADLVTDRLTNAKGLANVHMNTCGDFTLMAKEHWFQIKGYPELEMYSMHIDSLGCHAAVNAGLEEVVLEDPMRIYHIEHGTGSGWTPEGEAKLFGRMKERGIPVIEFHQLVQWITDMREKGPIEFNNDDWGLAKYDLKETRIGKI